jgi:hypothetical protein
MKIRNTMLTPFTFNSPDSLNIYYFQVDTFTYRNNRVVIAKIFPVWSLQKVSTHYLNVPAQSTSG